MLSDIEIAQAATLLPITRIAEALGIPEEDLELYGKYKAKISNRFLQKVEHNPQGKLVLVTAINPTPAGEGKTTVTVGLGQAMQRLGMRAMCVLREPSMGPVFGMKGGAAGGGYSQVLPMEEINLHFTGDMHAITAANNLLCATIDNHLQHGNALGIDPRRILFARCLDMNDRALRNVTIGLGGKVNGVPREDHFQITVASEVMAILCLSKNREELRERLGNMLIAFRFDGCPIFSRELGVCGAMTLLLKDAINPNLVQTIENSPVLMHGGPFANIAHGCNSLRATQLALKLTDIVITEAGFGSDLGAEKFFNIKCRAAGLRPDCVVIVATVRALKYHGGVPKTRLSEENVAALQRGIGNLQTHVENISKFGVPAVVALNRFSTDTEDEIHILEKECKNMGISCVLTEVFEHGGAGGACLAREIEKIIDKSSKSFHFLYELNNSIEEKLNKISREIYRAKEVVYTAKARKSLQLLEELGFGALPICVAKTQYSLSDDPERLGAPRDFSLTVRDLYVNAGAGFIVALTGEIMVMPGLPKVPAACAMEIDAEDVVHGLF